MSDKVSNIDFYELLRRNQNDTSDYVENILKELNVPYSMDVYGNIYNLDFNDVPVLSAHMDTVRKDEDFCIGAFLTEDDGDRIFTGGVLGGDDKCGVYIILKILETGKKVNFVFSRDEEIGLLGIKAFAESKEIQDKLKSCLYCLVLDRRGNSDIICSNNNYGTKEFEDALVKVSENGKHDYKPATGLLSDANILRDYISTVNLSTGYYSPHSQKEYIIKSDVVKCYNYVLDIIDNITTRFEAAPEKTYSYYSYYNSTSNCSSHYKKDWYDKDWYDEDWIYEDWYGYSYDGYKNANNDLDKDKHFCDFCNTYIPQSEPTVKFTMPDGTSFNICETCLEDMEAEIKKARQEFDKLGIANV